MEITAAARVEASVVIQIRIRLSEEILFRRIPPRTMAVASIAVQVSVPWITILYRETTQVPLGVE